MNDWKARAEREAAAILSQIPALATMNPTYEQTVALVAIGWMQGVNFGSHYTLEKAEEAFERMQAAL